MSEDKSTIPPDARALLLALQLTGTNTRALEALDDLQWTRLLEFCDVSHLTLTLARLPLEGAPLWVSDRLKQNLTDNALRYAAIKSTYCEAAAALNRAGVDHIVIKGFTQAPDYVDRPEVRSQSDLDLYCPPQQLKTAQAALEQIGYKPEPHSTNMSADHGRALLRLGDWQWRGNPFDPEMPLGIELHFCLWNQQVSRLDLPDVDLFWKRRTSRKIDDLSFPCLDRVDHLGFLSLHILRNLLLRDWIVHHVYELAVFLHSHAKDDAFWNSWIESHSPALRSLEAVAICHARDWFQCRLHPHAAQQIATLPIPTASWLDRFSGSALENMFRQNKDVLWLHLSLLQSNADRLAILKRTLIPPKIASPDAPIVQIRNKRLTQSTAGPLRKYLSYLIARSASHCAASFTALGHGFSLWISRFRLPGPYWLFLALSFFFDLGLSIYYFLFNLFLMGHGFDEKALGLLTSATAVGNLAGALPSGKLARRFGLRPVLFACFTLAVIVSSARALLLSFSIQLMLAFMAGTILSAWAVCLSPAVAQLTQEKQRPRAFSLLFSLGIGMGAIGGFVGSRLPYLLERHPIHLALEPPQIVLLIACAIVAMGLWPLTKLHFTSTAETPSGTRSFALSPFLLRFLPAMAVWSLVTGSFSPLASVYLAKGVHLSLQQIGDAFSLSQIAQVAAVLLAPLLFRKWGLFHGILFTQLGAAVMLLLLSSTIHPKSVIVFYIFFCSFQWMNEPGLYSVLMNSVAPTDRESASASNSFVVSASQAVAAALFGSAFALYGYPGVIRIIAGIAIFAAILFSNIERVKGTQTESSAALG